MAAAIREVREEAGSSLQVTPLGVFHAHSVRYDDLIPPLVSVCVLFEAGNTSVVAGSDMAGSVIRWLNVEQMIAQQSRVVVPSAGDSDGPYWLFERALKSYDQWTAQGVEPIEKLQPTYSRVSNKYVK
ncbi:MAG: NUDIX hydrolase [Proteobacteria bacterium]|nr:NUDIX hydrolase [Pseudomonadota bacterium]MDA1059261.1 NUDIX hydrolase [Pseudomonadota bacterium]